MGNANSRKKQETSPKNNEEFKKMKIENVIDYIATKYVTQADFKDLKNLNKKEYCDKLVILTSKVIKHHLNDIEIAYMDQRTKKGIEINKMNKANILYLDKNDLNRLDITNSVRKKRMCVGIAKFYVKIAHLFAAIAMAINPQYSYTDLTGIERSVSLMEKKNIPSNFKIKYSKNNLCSRRIQALMTKQNTANGIVIKPENCNMNIKELNEKDGVNVPIMTNSTKNLNDESGIPELELLYYDEYDFNKGEYYGMSKEAKIEYNNDVEKFYKMFTGNKNIPLGSDGTPSIKKFSDIPLKDFHNQKLCVDKDSPWLKSYKGSTSDKLFKQYADHLNEMIVKSQKQESILLEVISEIFSYWIDPEKKEKQLTINPKLTDETLKPLIDKTRETLIELYINCENDFQKGLEIFEAIIKSKMLETAKRKISKFDTLSDELTTNKTNVTKEAVEEQPVEEQPVEEQPVEEQPVLVNQEGSSRKKKKTRKKRKQVKKRKTHKSRR
mgnify:CR=1 FL=1